MGEKSQRGYFGDSILNEQTGSKLWLLDRSKFTNDTLIKAKEYAKSSLDWLVTDKLAKEIHVEAYFNEQNKMILNVSIFKNNNEIESITINNLWNNL